MKINFKKSFTLIELVVCIAIITIFLSVVRISIQSKNRTIAMEELNEVYEILNNVKSYAISKNEEISVSFDMRKNFMEISGDKYYFEKIFFKSLKVKDTKKIIFNKNGIVTKGDSILFLVFDKKFVITLRPATSFIDIREKNE